MYQLILASASPRRKEILNQVGAEFITIVSHIEEPFNSSDIGSRLTLKCICSCFIHRLSGCNIRKNFLQTNPKELVQKLSYEKATEVAKRVDATNAVILGADTLYKKENVGYERKSNFSIFRWIRYHCNYSVVKRKL